MVRYEYACACCGRCISYRNTVTVAPSRLHTIAYLLLPSAFTYLFCEYVQMCTLILTTDRNSLCELCLFLIHSH